MLRGDRRGCLPAYGFKASLLRQRGRGVPCLVHVAAEQLIVTSQSPDEPLGSDDTMLLLVMRYLHGHAAS